MTTKGKKAGFFVHPYNKKFGWRTGKDPTAGKVIRKDDDGYENFEDYLSESESEVTVEIQNEKENEVFTEGQEAINKSQRKQKSYNTRSNSNKQSYLVRNNVEYNQKVLGVNPIAWLTNQNIGRRTGKDLLAGKTIRKDEDGYENFEDYLSESDADSLMESRMSSKSLMISRLSQGHQLSKDCLDQGAVPQDISKSNFELSSHKSVSDDSQYEKTEDKDKNGTLLAENQRARGQNDSNFSSEEKDNTGGDEEEANPVSHRSYHAQNGHLDEDSDDSDQENQLEENEATPVSHRGHRAQNGSLDEEICDSDQESQGEENEATPVSHRSYHSQNGRLDENNCDSDQEIQEEENEATPVNTTGKSKQQREKSMSAKTRNSAKKPSRQSVKRLSQDEIKSTLPKNQVQINLKSHEFNNLSTNSRTNTTSKDKSRKGISESFQNDKTETLFTLTNNLEHVSKLSHRSEGQSYFSKTGIDIGGNVTGSITKNNEMSTGSGLTPTFQTRKRLSYSVAALEAMRLSGSKELNTCPSDRSDDSADIQLRRKSTHISIPPIILDSNSQELDLDSSSKFLSLSTKQGKLSKTLKEIETDDSESIEIIEEEINTTRKNNLTLGRKKNSVSSRKNNSTLQKNRSLTTRKSSINNKSNVKEEEIDVAKKSRSRKSGVNEKPETELLYKSKRKSLKADYSEEVDGTNTNTDNSKLENKDTVTKTSRKRVKDRKSLKKVEEQVSGTNMGTSRKPLKNRELQESNTNEIDEHISLSKQRGRRAKSLSNIQVKNMDCSPKTRRTRTKSLHGNVEFGLEIKKIRAGRKTSSKKGNKDEKAQELQMNDVKQRISRRKTVTLNDTEESDNLLDTDGGQDVSVHSLPSSQQDAIVQQENMNIKQNDDISDVEDDHEITLMTKTKSSFKKPQRKKRGTKSLSDAYGNNGTKGNVNRRSLDQQRSRVERSRRRGRKRQHTQEESVITHDKPESLTLGTPTTESPERSLVSPIIVTPVSHHDLGQLEVLKSGVSFRHSRRTSVIDAPEQTEEDGNQPENNDDGNTDDDEVEDEQSTAKELRLTSSIKDHMHIDSPDLTPCIRQPGSTSRSKGRRVTISKLVTEKSYQVLSDSSGDNSKLTNSVNESSMPSFSSSPMHVFETTNTETQVCYKPLDVPRILKPEEPQNGLRRSRRNRCKPVAWYKGERIVYARRKSGLGIVRVEPSQVEMKVLQKEAKRRKLLRKAGKRKMLKSLKSPVRNLSVHMTMDSEFESMSSDEVTVINEDTGEEVLMDCMFSKDQDVYLGPTKEHPTPADPYIMSVTANQPTFMTGSLIIRPLQEKPMQVVTMGTMIFKLDRGKVLVTIHHTMRIAEAGDTFFIPKGNVYSLKNMRKDEAKLSFTCVYICDSNTD